jgi:DNA-binding NarL/FixJ family response regulator
METIVGKTRVLLAIESPLLRQLLGNRIQQEGDLELVGEITDPIDILVAVRETETDVVVQSWPESEEIPAIATHLFAEYPHLVLVGLSPDFDRICVCRQVIETSVLALPGFQEIVDAIRSLWVKDYQESELAPSD